MRCECFECALRESESDECAYIVAYSAGQPAGIFPNSPRLFRIPARHHERLPSGRQCSEGPTPLELITRSPASLFAVRSVRSAQRPCSLHRRQRRELVAARDRGARARPSESSLRVRPTGAARREHHRRRRLPNSMPFGRRSCAAFAKSEARCGVGAAVQPLCRHRLVSMDRDCRPCAQRTQSEGCSRYAVSRPH